MDIADARRDRLDKLLGLAQAYRGWNRKQLAAALGRDPTKLVPGSGVPKLDLVVDLSQALDWPVEVVVEALTDDSIDITDAFERESREDFAALDEQAKQAHREGDYKKMINLARRAWQAAKSSNHRATACNREAGGWDGLGRYANVLQAVQRGLGEPDVKPDTRVMLQANLANAYYTLWHVLEARSTARDLIDQYEQQPPTNRLNEVVHAFAPYVRGNAYRRMISIEQEKAKSHAQTAHADLETARSRYLQLADKYDDDSYRGVANTCVGAMMELDAVLGTSEPEDVLEKFSDQLDSLIDPEQFPVGDWLESYGWWCIFACNVALRHISDEKALQQHMAVFTNKADEIANRLDNWAMRERVFTMEFARRQRLLDWTGVSADWTIDNDDIRVITGTMGRFPAFQRTGWQILQTARVIRD